MQVKIIQVFWGNSNSILKRIMLYLLSRLNNYQYFMPTSNLQPPKFTEAILKKERIAFQTQASSFHDKKIGHIILALNSILLITIILKTTQTVLIPFFTLLVEYKFNPIPAISDTSNANLTILSAIIFISIIVLNSIFKLVRRHKKGPWFIGTDNFLLLATEDNSVPIAWNYLSEDIKTIEKNNFGSIYMRYDRKDFATPQVKKLLETNNRYSIQLIGIENPAQIARICLAKIQDCKK